MTWGPFNSDLSGKPIMNHLSKQVFPALKDIQLLSLEIGDYKQGFINSFFRKNLTRLQEKYRIANKRFLQAYHTYQTPDELFKESNFDPDKDKEKIATLILDYSNTKSVILPHFNDGFSLLEIMDRNLARCSQSADQRVSIFLSITAITVSVVIAVC